MASKKSQQKQVLPVYIKGMFICCILISLHSMIWGLQENILSKLVVPAIDEAF